MSESMTELLTLDRASLAAGDYVRGHLTRRLHVPQDAPGHTDAQAKVAIAHFVMLDAWPVALPETADAGLILGCFGDYLPDTEIPWEAWFGERGVRDAANLDAELARFRGQQKRHANLLLAGSSTPSRQLRGRVELACRIRCHVGLTGPSGCGAEEIASLIHHTSAAGEAIVCLDASLMDAELLEVYAAPVIADLREQAESAGTLCLDRLDEMPADAQARLVEWLDAWPDRLRLIGILNDELPSECEAIQLSDAIADAMEIFRVCIPPLASRRVDLDLIATGWVRSARLSREALELIQSYPWPGQWSEFTAALQFAVETVTGDRIGREHLPLAIRSYRAPSHVGSRVSRHEHEVTIAPPLPSLKDFRIDSLDDAVSEYESELINQAMAAAEGNKADAARRLGISRSRLLRKLVGDSRS